MGPQCLPLLAPRSTVTPCTAPQVDSPHTQRQQSPLGSRVVSLSQGRGRSQTPVCSPTRASPGVRAVVVPELNQEGEREGEAPLPLCLSPHPLAEGRPGGHWAKLLRPRGTGSEPGGRTAQPQRPTGQGSQCPNVAGPGCQADSGRAIMFLESLLLLGSEALSRGLTPILPFSY